MSEKRLYEYNNIQELFVAGGGEVWRRLDLKKVLGIVAVISGAAILILSIPSWIWMMALGGFLLWFGWTMFTTNR